MISVKIYKQGRDVIVGACDEKLLGKKFTKGNIQIDASSNFYDGERVNKKTLKKYLEDATIANLVGVEAVKCAVEMGLVDPHFILKIKGVPHAQMVRMI